ncbi:MAG: hypothetical protein ACLTAC_25925, partial [Hungatella sp.]
KCSLSIPFPMSVFCRKVSPAKEKTPADSVLRFIGLFIQYSEKRPWNQSSGGLIFGNESKVLDFKV